MDYTTTIAHTHTHRGRRHLGKVVLYAIGVDFHSELGTLLVPWAQVLATEQLQRGRGIGRRQSVNPYKHKQAVQL